MTKDKMAERIQQLEERLGIQNKPTKMVEIETLESDTMVKVLDLVRNCEKVTGRELELANSKEVFSGEIKNGVGPLRAMVEELRDFAMNSGSYDFATEDALASWVYNKLARC